MATTETPIAYAAEQALRLLPVLMDALDEARAFNGASDERDRVADVCEMLCLALTPKAAKVDA